MKPALSVNSGSHDILNNTQIMEVFRKFTLNQN